MSVLPTLVLTHMHVENVLIPVPSLLHVGTQGRNGRGTLLEGWRAGQERLDEPSHMQRARTRAQEVDTFHVS
jgi:hypothetical protein